MSNHFGNENPRIQCNCLSSAWVYYVALISLSKWVSIRYIFKWRVGSIVNKTQNIFLWLLKKKTLAKRSHYESNSDHEEKYPKFIELESKEELGITKLSPFIIEKIISLIITLIWHHLCAIWTVGSIVEFRLCNLWLLVQSPVVEIMVYTADEI